MGPVSTPEPLVAAAAIVDDLAAPRLLLAARRSAPPALRGGWEFPGGKVEPGESPEQALVREVREELGCRVRVHRWLQGQVPIDSAGTMVLRVALAELVGGDPDPVEHDEVRWLAGDQLGTVGWLVADRPFLPELVEILGP